MSPSWATFLFETANFLLLAALLGWLFFRPVRGILERQRALLETERRETEESRGEARRELAEAQKLRAELEASLSGLRERGRQEAEREAAALLDSVRDQAGRERKALEAELVALRRGEARARSLDSVSAAREIVVRLLARIGGPDIDHALLRAACSELAQLAAGGRLDPVIVEAPSSLGTEALASLSEAAGIAPDRVGQRIVPELVAGVRIVTGRGLVDASVAGLAAQAEQAIVARIDGDEAAHE